MARRKRMGFFQSTSRALYLFCLILSANQSTVPAANQQQHLRHLLRELLNAEIEIQFCNQWQSHIFTVWDRTLPSKMTALTPQSGVYQRLPSDCWSGEEGMTCQLLTSLPLNTSVFPPPDSSLQINRAQLTFPSHSFDAFQATPTSWLTELSQTGLSNQKTDNLQPYESKKENADLLRAVTSENEGCSEPSGERDYLLEYILAHQRNDDSQPLPFPAVEPNGAEAFQDPFPPVFNADVFSDTPLSASGDIFHTPVSGLFQSTPLYQNSTSTTTDIKVFDPFSDDYTEKDGLFKEQKVQSDGQFTASVNTSRDGPPDVSPVTASADGVLMFRRRPPKPVPRGIRKNLNQAVDFQPQFVPPTPAPAYSGNYQSQLIPIQAPPTSTPDLSLTPDLLLFQFQGQKPAFRMLHQLKRKIRIKSMWMYFSSVRRSV
ncbi:uncharacterized protein [Hoplias malabaricus]|uniref:uncharacterized protein n=1 Tax=Hoplias malabaricus TaxID=27720 RepID=UPI0034623932